MKTLLITSSPRGEASHSTQLARHLAAQLAGGDLQTALIERALDRDPVPFIGEAFVKANSTPAESRSETDREALRISDTLIEEMRQAEGIVIGAGMINFGVPAPLKAWIDQVTRAGVTFSYAGGKPEGLLKGKKTYLVLASGGMYSTGAAESFDFQRPYLLHALGFLGLTDVEVVLVEGTAFGPDAGREASAHAATRIAELVSSAKQLGGS